MIAALGAHHSGRGRHRDQPELAVDGRVPPAIAPGKTTLPAREITLPPAVAVSLIGVEPRSSPAGARRLDPRRRQDLSIAAPAPIEIELAERQQLPRRHQHVVSAEVDALRIAGPPAQRGAEPTRQRRLSEGPGGLPG